MSRPHQPALRLVGAVVLLAVLLQACARERIVFRERSQFQEVVVTEEPGNIRTLRFGRWGAMQSRVQIGRPDVLLLPYVRATMMGLAFVEEPERVLVVGLGGGSIPAYLRLKRPNARIDVAELDPVVIQVAREWFGLVEDENLRVTVGDGRRFVEEVQSPYDLVILDAFGKDSVPAALTTREFLSAVRSALTPRGAVVANLWEGRTNPLFASMVATYQAVFSEVFVFPVPHTTNRILVALMSPDSAPSDLSLEVGQLTKTLGGNLGLRELLAQGDPRSTPGDGAVAVLRDP